jgi:type IV pilus assembly protein PilA
MIVIVIVGILSSVALPNFLNQTSKAKATECTTKAGSSLSAYGADALGDKTEALATAVQSAADST